MSTDGHDLFFATNLNQQYDLVSWPLSGGSASTLFSGAADARVFASANGRVYFAQPSTCAQGSHPTYAVWEIGADKSNLRVDESGLEVPTAMAADSSYVYVATQDSGFGKGHIRRFSQ